MSTIDVFSDLPELPVKAVLSDIMASLDAHPNLVLVAPPGAGKTTLVPLALLQAQWLGERKLIVLEPRRLAARAAASRMASLFKEDVGETVGYRVRFDSKISAKTRIEVVTEGVFSRMLADDPGLENVAAVLFDEFHERSLDGDLSLALCLDLQSALRDDLRLIPMSATIDGAGVSALMNAPLIESEGRTFPVELSYAPRVAGSRLEPDVAAAVRDVLKNDDTGSILVFLPGQAEIERTYKLLLDKMPSDVALHRLYGALHQKDQDAAIAAVPDGTRKVVLSSAIAETSLTINGIDTVVDSGLSRQPVFEPSTGLTRLQTVRASKASVDQRAGRAGRLRPGRAIRLWHEGQMAALPKQTIPEILNADLCAFVLELADWGVVDVGQLSWLDQPPEPALVEARKKLVRFGALNTEGQITTHGKDMRSLSLEPSLAHGLLKAAEFGEEAARRMAVASTVQEERGVGGHSVDLSHRCDRVVSASDGRSKRVMQLAEKFLRHPALIKVRKATKQSDHVIPSDGILLAHAYPDRIAQRTGQAADGTVRYRLANGRGAQIDATESLSREAYLLIVDMVGRAGAARIVSATALSKDDLTNYFEDAIETESQSCFDPKTGSFTTTRTCKLGALVLEKPVSTKARPEDLPAALVSAVQEHGIGVLPWRDDDIKLRQRLGLLHQVLGETWPNVDDRELIENLDTWLLPFLGNVKSLSDLKNGALSDAMNAYAGFPAKAVLNELVPTHFAAPSGSSVPLDYMSEAFEAGTSKVVLRVRPQELFGLDVHPAVANGKQPVEIEFLSPAGRAIQITQDLSAFWRGSWRDVRSDLRGRYPKHPWPENPLEAEPTRRIKAKSGKT